MRVARHFSGGKLRVRKSVPLGTADPFLASAPSPPVPRFLGAGPLLSIPTPWALRATLSLLSPPSWSIIDLTRSLLHAR
jgi:hypothetical protein